MLLTCKSYALLTGLIYESLLFNRVSPSSIHPFTPSCIPPTIPQPNHIRVFHTANHLPVAPPSATRLKTKILRQYNFIIPMHISNCYLNTVNSFLCTVFISIYNLTPILGNNQIGISRTPPFYPF